MVDIATSAVVPAAHGCSCCILEQVWTPLPVHS